MAKRMRIIIFKSMVPHDRVGDGSVMVMVLFGLGLNTRFV